MPLLRLRPRVTTRSGERVQRDGVPSPASMLTRACIMDSSGASPSECALSLPDAPGGSLGGGQDMPAHAQLTGCPRSRVSGYNLKLYALDRFPPPRDPRLVNEAPHQEEEAGRPGPGRPARAAVAQLRRH